MQEHGAPGKPIERDDVPLAQDAPKIPDHQIIRCVGAGGFGEVWLATPRSLPGTYRAVKVVRRNSSQGTGFDREYRGIQWFEPISRSHPNLVNILHVGEDPGKDYFFYVMELADSATPMRNPAQPTGSRPAGNKFDPRTYEPKSLEAELRMRGRLPLDECIEVALALTSGLAHLHQHGLIHRDIKPSNIIFVGGVAKLADIGLVADANLAVTFVGTGGYIPPEGPGTPQADLYSLGKVSYQMVTALDRNDYPQLPDDWAEQPCQSVLMAFNNIILRACEGDVAARYQTAEEMHAELLHLRQKLQKELANASNRTRGLWWKAALPGLLLAAAVLLLWQWPHRPSNKSQSLVRAISLSTQEKSEGFKPLFNATNLEGWNAPGKNWVAEEGALTRASPGGDITYEAEQLPDNFDLRFDWKVASGSDSGVLYRPNRVEYQILDNGATPVGANPATWAGALYDFGSVPPDRTRPVGQWNESRILCEGDRVRHFLNGEIVLDAHYTQPEWVEARQRLKTKYNADLGARGGFLVLRDEVGQVWFRNLRWKALE